MRGFKQVLKVAEDPAVSGWLKTTLMDAINRDPVSAAEDAEFYAEFFNCEQPRSNVRPSARTPKWKSIKSRAEHSASKDASRNPVVDPAKVAAKNSDALTAGQVA